MLALSSGRPLGEFLPLSFPTCTLTGFLLNICCMLDSRAVCEQDRQSLPSGLTF